MLLPLAVGDWLGGLEEPGAPEEAGWCSQWNHTGYKAGQLSPGFLTPPIKVSGGETLKWLLWIQKCFFPLVCCSLSSDWEGSVTEL